MSRAPRRRREDLRELRLADAGLALEEERPAELQGQEDGGRERAVAQVVAARGTSRDAFDRARFGRAEVVGLGHGRSLHVADAGTARRVRSGA